MKEFFLAYRTDYSKMPAFSAEEAQAMSKRWMDWIGSIAAQNKLVERGNRLFNHGKVLKANDIITNGPFTEIKESLGGYSVIRAESYEEAEELAKECPILTLGGSVEIREVNAV